MKNKTLFLWILLVASCVIWTGITELAYRRGKRDAHEDIRKSIKKIDRIEMETWDTNVYRVGYADGWVAYSIDSFAISTYHHRAKLLTNDDPAALNGIWERCLDEAVRQEVEWSALSNDQKLTYIGTPFWKRNAGEPRRFNRTLSTP